ncbi:MAG TPA: BTAD domain-containing putative transcriptional regulator, partial [Actinomycetota bacterium]|nr:BTAD domain-containing putative transcriptional regulator [Actinomycetota bacterium]
LLFGEADDPLGALRWNLAELRRLLGLPDGLQGSPIELALPAGTFVDVRAVGAGTWLQALEMPGLGRELLEGMSFGTSPAFEAWLLAERRHLQARAEAVLHEAALVKLAGGQSHQAIDLASRLVAMNPFEESFHELLIRAYAASGDTVGATRQLAACVELFRRELGVEPGPAVHAAAQATAVSATSTAVTGRAAARAQLDAGEAAIGAGAVDAGLECLRRAAAEAHACGDLELKARALLSLGAALAHAARGRDEEAAAALHEAVAIALRAGRPQLAAAARRELAWIDILRGRYARALAQIEAARRTGGEDVFLTGLAGACAYQLGRYREGLALLGQAAQRAEEVGDRRTLVLALGEIGLIHVMLEDRRAATEVLERTLAEARALAWNAYLPYPEALLGILELSAGDAAGARERLEHAFALACQIRDCCWEGMAAAGLALLDEAAGDVRAARDRFEDARHRSVREPDAWLWGHAFVLDLACAFAVRHGLEEARSWVGDLELVAGRTMIREFLARAYRYRHDLGDPSGLEVALALVAEVDNPALRRRIEQAPRPLGEATASSRVPRGALEEGPGRGRR